MQRSLQHTILQLIDLAPCTGIRDAEKHRLLTTASRVLGSEVETARIGKSRQRTSVFISVYSVSCFHQRSQKHGPTVNTNRRSLRFAATRFKLPSLMLLKTYTLKSKPVPIAAGVLEAPKAAKQPHTVTAPHGKAREDPYYWLRDDDRSKPEMLDYLKASL